MIAIEMCHVNKVIQQSYPIKVIGIGNGGLSAVNHMSCGPIQGAEFICADTDERALSRSVSGCTLQLGASGLGAANPDKGRCSAELSVNQIRKAIDGAKMLLIIAGMGGGTGTGAAPVIARVAQEMGILTVGVVTTPGSWETGKRMRNANVGLAELKLNVDSLTVLSLDRVIEVLGDDLTQDEFFAHTNEILKNMVREIALLNRSGTRPQRVGSKVATPF